MTHTRPVAERADAMIAWGMMVGTAPPWRHHDPDAWNVAVATMTTAVERVAAAFAEAVGPYLHLFLPATATTQPRNRPAGACHGARR